MRVEAGQHAGDRGLHQLAVGDRVDRVMADPFKGFVKQIELFEDTAVAAATTLVLRP